MRGLLYALVQMTWGFPQTLLGFGVFSAHARRPHFRYHGAIVTTWESHKALSLGPFIFLNGSDDSRTAPESVHVPLLVHEYGHTIQSLALGPLYLPVVGVPSLLWLNMPACARRRQLTGRSYYAFYTERLANQLAWRFLHEHPHGSEN